MTKLYRMHDSDLERHPGVIEIDRDYADRWNDEGYGIFVTVNEFNGARRKECLRKIRAWAVDMDVGSKADQHRRLMSAPLVPTMIVETKRGFQAWWGALDGTADHWNAIVLERLVPFFGADKNARDICRILRAPGYWHMKDPANPFKCEKRWFKPHVAYTELQMARAFEWIPNADAQRDLHRDARRAAEAEIREAARANAIAAGLAPTESMWDAIYALDCAEGLMRLSGHWAVGGETYRLRPTSKGRLNIFVNGKSSPCFVDENKRIGSPSGGGPTLAQWLRWFKHDWRTVIAVLKDLFPKLDEIDRAARDADRRSVASNGGTADRSAA